MDDRQMLVDNVKGYIKSHPNMNMNLAHEMAKFVQNLYDMLIRQDITMALQNTTIEAQGEAIESLRKTIESQKKTIAVLKQDQIIKSII